MRSKLRYLFAIVLVSVISVSAGAWEWGFNNLSDPVYIDELRYAPGSSLLITVKSANGILYQNANQNFIELRTSIFTGEEYNRALTLLLSAKAANTPIRVSLDVNWAITTLVVK
jgi:hypothetical protein